MTSWNEALAIVLPPLALFVCKFTQFPNFERDGKKVTGPAIA
ncbi:hypothetical protein NZK35_05450 [Stieleria sp. ICT_E10.1]|nr:hypothetical protein [Stieleria sedimenti]MCS7466118.1 hypothetical protein [Stieleria sedimenti]